MIIHASMKMDISKYLKWLEKRLSDGFFDRDLNEKVVNRILLKDVQQLVLYTRTPSAVYMDADILRKYNPKLITYLSQYDRLIEPKIKEKEKIIKCIKKCRKQFEQNYFGYGPVFFSETHDKEWHLAQFDFLCHQLSAYIDGVYIDFNIGTACQKAKDLSCKELDEQEKTNMMDGFLEIADRHKVKAETIWTSDTFKSNEIDIGEENCCPHVCRHCPHITNRKSATDKYKAFDHESTMLYGIITNSQKIVELDLDESLRSENKGYEQTSLFDMINI